MNFSLAIRPEAAQDIREARQWYEGRRQGLGSSFVAQVGEVLTRIQEMPDLFAVVYRTVRRCKTRRFPYVIYYRIVGDRVEVLAVVHASRHSDVWQSRV